MTDKPQTALVRSAFDTVAHMLVQNQNRLRALLPAHVTPEHISAVVLQSLRRNPYLLECEPASIIDSALRGAELGLEVGGVLGEAWLLPFRDKGTKKCQMVIGYQGLIKLAYQHPRVLAVKAVLVREGDVFAHIEGSRPEIIHRPALGSTREVIAAYCRWQLAGGAVECDVMSRADIDAQKADSLRKLQDWQIKTSPWTVHEGEMQKKTVLRRSAKYAPRSSALDRALEFEMQRDKLAAEGEDGGT